MRLVIDRPWLGLTPKEIRAGFRKAQQSTLPCAHLGDIIRLTEKSVCCGRTAQFKIYSCEIHGECALDIRAGVKTCACEHYSPREQSLSILTTDQKE